MLCLELMTGMQPYSDIAQDVTVAIALSKIQLPPRPGHPAISRGLTGDLWSLMMKCWNKNPEFRPSMMSIKADIRRLRGDVGSSPAPRTVEHSQLLLSSDTIRLPEPSILTHSPAQIHAELIPESPSKPISPAGRSSRPSTAGSSSSESKGRRSSAFGLFGALKRHSRSSSSRQPSPPETFHDVPYSTSSISPISSPILPEIKTVLPEIKTFAADSNEGAFGVFDSAQMEALSTISQRRTTHDHTVLRNRGGSVLERSTSRGSNLQIYTPSSLPQNYGSHMQPMSTFEGKPPSMLSMDCNASTSSGTMESTASNEPPLVSQAEDGTIEAATLEGLIEQMIADFSCE